MCIMPMLMIVTIAFIMMRMPKNCEFLKQEKSQQAGEQRREQRMDIRFGFEGFRQRM